MALIQNGGLEAVFYTALQVQVVSYRISRAPAVCPTAEARRNAKSPAREAMDLPVQDALMSAFRFVGFV